MNYKSYEAAWRDLEGREAILKNVGQVVRWVLVPFSFFPELIFIPFMFAAFVVFDWLSVHSLGWQIVLAVFSVAAVPGGFLFYLWSFRCPRCHKPFFSRRLHIRHDPDDGKRCVHCSLAKGASPEVPNSSASRAIALEIIFVGSSLKLVNGCPSPTMSIRSLALQTCRKFF